MKTALLWLCLSGLAGGELYAQVSSTVLASYDTTAVAELFDRVPVGFIFSGAGATRGWLGGRIPWKALSVTSPQGTVKDGILTFDRYKVWQNGHQVSFTVIYQGRSYHGELSLPFVESLRFHLFTDSLKRDNPFDLNVVGRFSSGKLLPLDTSMVSFTGTGGGRISAGRLTVAGSDTLTRFIHVTARLRSSPEISDSVTIPVKIIPDTAQLPSEEQLLDKWQRRGRRR